MNFKLLKMLCKNLVLLLFLASLSACATGRKPVVGIVSGREVETLQSPISVSVRSGEHGTSGRGYLIFKKPDRFHMAILSPFGLTAFEIFSDSDRLTCVIPSRQTAYSGFFSELPESNALKSMEMLKWVVARPPAAGPPPGSRELITNNGDHYYYDHYGLIERKVSPAGDQVIYEDYHSISGVAVPGTLIIESRFGTTIRIVFDEPEINTAVEESALTPNLQDYTVLPLAQFKGL